MLQLLGDFVLRLLTEALFLDSTGGRTPQTHTPVFPSLPFMTIMVHFVEDGRGLRRGKIEDDFYDSWGERLI